MSDLIESVKAAVSQHKVNRRGFLKLTGIAGSGFIIASIAPLIMAEENLGTLVGSAELNAFVEISSDGTITIYSSNPEMGQGIKTALPMIIAEEMGAKWEDVKVLQSSVDATRFGPQQAGGSTTVPRTFDQMRRMGASAREMLRSAGSEAMEVSRDELKVAESKVTHTTGKFLTFGQLAALAIRQKVPDEDSLMFKAREDYTIIGTSVSGVDNMMISTGLALFGIDTRVPEMLYACYQKCPAIGGKVVKANIDEIRKLPGVVDAFVLDGNDDPRQLLDGVAIVGTSTWAAFSARNSLEVQWDESSASKDSWSGLVERATQLHGTRGKELVIDKGDVKEAYANPENTTLEAFYEYPFVSHFTMEPMNCTAHYRKGSDASNDSLELWLPTQGPARGYQIAKSMFGLEEDQVTIHMMRMGGSFGRRVYFEYIAEAIAISKQVNKPVKLTWSREDDLHHDFYRSGGFQSVKGSVDKQGRLIAFEDHFMGMNYDGRPVSGSRFPDTEFPILNVKNAHASKTFFDIKTPCGPWRAPGSNTTAFVVQSFLDELSHAAGRDYLEFLLEIMGERRWFEEGNVRSLNTGRAADVIKLAAKEAGWGKSMPKGSGLGLAFYFSHAGHIAEVAEVSVDKNRHLTVHKVTVAVDVGPIINMSGATSQVEGAVIDGLSTMMAQKITMEAGRIQQDNFHNYEVLRIPDSPRVDVHFIQSDFGPTGLGEPALPPLAPAVGNAIFAATGHRVRKMPLSEQGYTI